MSDGQLGTFFALATALCWSSAVIFFRRAGAQIEPLPLNVFKNVVALLCYGIVIGVQGLSVWGLGAWGTLKIIISGLSGVALGDTLFLMSLNRLGASRFAMVELFYAPLTAAAAFFLLGERLGARHIVGGILILCGVLLSMRPAKGAKAAEGIPHFQDRLWGWLYGTSAMLTTALSVVWIKEELKQVDLMEAACLRIIGGTLVLALWLGVRASGRRKLVQAFYPAPVWKDSIPGAVFGLFLANYCWLAGYRYIEAGTAALLNQTSSLVLPILAALFLGEVLTTRFWFGLVLGFIGTMIVSFGAMPH